MTALAHAAADDVRAIVSAFTEGERPLRRGEVLATAERLGWTVRSAQERGILFMTGLPYRRARADCLLLEGELGQLTVGLSDRADDPAQQAQLRAVEQEVLAVLAELLGGPGDRSSGRSRTSWDLGSGARVAVENVGDRVILVVLGMHVADLERAEARLGVDPDRVVGRDR